MFRNSLNFISTLCFETFNFSQQLLLTCVCDLQTINIHVSFLFDPGSLVFKRMIWSSQLLAVRSFLFLCFDEYFRGNDEARKNSMPSDYLFRRIFSLLIIFLGSSFFMHDTMGKETNALPIHELCQKCNNFQYNQVTRREWKDKTLSPPSHALHLNKNNSSSNIVQKTDDAASIGRGLFTKSIQRAR